MSRKKTADQTSLLSYPVRTRVNEQTWKQLEKLMHESGCQSIGEVARMVLSGQPIKCFYVDTSMNGVMEQLALIRKELKAIGININQQTRYFNSSKNEAQRSFYALKTSDLYKQVDTRTAELLGIINHLAVKWLQGS